MTILTRASRSLFKTTSPKLARGSMAFSTGMKGRVGFEELTADADAEQLQFMKEEIVQVDETDAVLGPISKKDGTQPCTIRGYVMDSIEHSWLTLPFVCLAHIHDGILHRAFSVFVFNSKNELLIQKRAAEKITFPGYWANTCCSHPLFTEAELEDGVGVKRAAIRKLEHELGIPSSTFAVDDLAYVSTVMYKAASDANWTEYEMDHILFARADVSLDNVNLNEVEQVEFVTRENLPALLEDSERKLSPWFHLIGARLLPQWWDNLDAMLAKDSADRQIHDYR
ncbi:hypothetical protein BBJ28_00013335 [Nothophytophthora sp. Chile5]|nr:hypothetical protein BBJ28_00013335 [Nothophytophthora sp. Chile5]